MGVGSKEKTKTLQKGRASASGGSRHLKGRERKLEERVGRFLKSSCEELDLYLIRTKGKVLGGRSLLLR